MKIKNVSNQNVRAIWIPGMHHILEPGKTTTPNLSLYELLADRDFLVLIGAVSVAGYNDLQPLKGGRDRERVKFNWGDVTYSGGPYGERAYVTYPVVNYSSIKEGTKIHIYLDRAEAAIIEGLTGISLCGSKGPMFRLYPCEGYDTPNPRLNSEELTPEELSQSIDGTPMEEGDGTDLTEGSDEPHPKDLIDKEKEENKETEPKIEVKIEEQKPEEKQIKSDPIEEEQKPEEKQIKSDPIEEVPNVVKVEEPKTSEVSSTKESEEPKEEPIDNTYKPNKSSSKDTKKKDKAKSAKKTKEPVSLDSLNK